eukprot:TRINITY_DN2117_c0_g2_i1.p1 TRINITY_DN2117_c0_g2~~TRINITY_DN2117_c0_g2_i1.p1  ORF type:complete len:532 (+),score=118.29 TRINITY_DN2117_c0_g2_i1:64-1659(+)
MTPIRAVTWACVAQLVRCTATTSSSCTEADGESCPAAPGEALLQRSGNRGRANQVQEAITESTDATPPKPPPVGSVRARKAPDGQSADVTFTYAGQKFAYALVATSVYTADAKVVRHTDKGEVEVPPEERVMFESRQKGRWASAILLEDGSVTGLFEDAGQVVHVEGWGADNHSYAEPALLELDAADGLPHHIKSIPPTLSLASGLKFKVIRKDNASEDEVPQVVIDNDPTNHLGHSTAEDEQFLIMEMSGGKSWEGTEWFPGCYNGDNQFHTLHIGVVTDLKAHQVYSSGKRSRIEGQVAEASFIYEKQMNFRLRIAEFHMYESSTGLPGDWAGASCGDQFISTKLQGLRQYHGGRSSSQRKVVSHLFTGCGTGWGTVGVAYLNAACGSYGVGVNQLKSNWITFAHELGHNLGGDHSFEDGQGSTGGIMDYGDGKLGGEYQFNTKYRKSAMCAKINNMGNCYNHFNVEATPAPTPPPCTDSASFRDRWWFTCSDWQGHDCNSYSSWWMPYNDGDRAKVRENCPVSCGMCR